MKIILVTLGLYLLMTSIIGFMCTHSWRYGRKNNQNERWYYSMGIVMLVATIIFLFLNALLFALATTVLTGFFLGKSASIFLVNRKTTQ